MRNRVLAYCGIVVVLLLASYALYSFHAAPLPGIPSAENTQKPVTIQNPFGQVIAESGRTIRLHTASGDLQVTVAENATITKDVASSTFASIKVGGLLSIASSTPNSDGSLTAYSIIIIPAALPAPSTQ